MRLDYGENLQGEIREEALDPIDVLLDPGARSYDPSTWNEVFTTRWLTPDEIEVIYGKDNADKVRYLNAESTLGYDSMMFDPETFAQQKNFFTQGQFNYYYEQDYKKCQRARVITRQLYKFVTRKYFVDTATGDCSPVPDTWPQDRVEMITQAFGLQIVMKAERRVRWRVTCDKYVFHDAWSPFRRFNVLPFFPYFRRGKPFGLVRNLIAPQDLTNKTLSQEMHVVNTTANSGWLIEAGTLINMTVDQLAQHGAKTGLILEYARGASPPQKIGANQIPTGLDRLSQKSTMYFREISGVSDAMLGAPGKEISGDALDSKTQRGLVQMDPIFDNLAFTRQLRAEFLLELFQEYYTEQRIFKMLLISDEGEDTEQEVIVNAKQASGAILNDITVGEYSVVVGSRPTRDVEDESEMKKMLSAREIGVMIPDWAIVEAMGLRRGKEIAEFIRKMTGAAEPTEQEIQMSQMTQELELRRMGAEVDELMARAQERMASAQKMYAEAESLSQGTQTDLLKFGAELRQNTEKEMLDLQKKREEIMARIQIMSMKTDETRYSAQLQALNKRLDSEAKERTAERTTQAQVARARGGAK